MYIKNMKLAPQELIQNIFCYLNKKSIFYLTTVEAS